MVTELNVYNHKDYNNWINIQNSMFAGKVNGVTIEDIEKETIKVYQDEIETPLLKFIDDLIKLGLDPKLKVERLEKY